MQNLTLKLPPRGLVALTGESGSGKTTLLQLLLGFLEPEAGEHSFERNPSRHPTRTPSLRARVGYVPQTTDLLRGSVRDNLLLGSRRCRTRVCGRCWRRRVLDETVRNLADELGYILKEDGAGAVGWAKNSAWRWRGHCSARRTCCCWTSRAPTWTPTANARSSPPYSVRAERRLVLVVAHRPALVAAAKPRARAARRPPARSRGQAVTLNIGLLLTYNEADVVEAMMAHNRHAVNAVFVLDGSSDGTDRILAQYPEVELVLKDEAIAPNRARARLSPPGTARGCDRALRPRPLVYP